MAEEDLRVSERVSEILDASPQVFRRSIGDPHEQKYTEERAQEIAAEGIPNGYAIGSHARIQLERQRSFSERDASAEDATWRPLGVDDPNPNPDPKPNPTPTPNPNPNPNPNPDPLTPTLTLTLTLTRGVRMLPT